MSRECDEVGGGGHVGVSSYSTYIEAAGLWGTGGGDMGGDNGELEMERGISDGWRVQYLSLSGSC